MEGTFEEDEIVDGKIIDKDGNIYETAKAEKGINNGKFKNGKLCGLVRIEY